MKCLVDELVVETFELTGGEARVDRHIIEINLIIIRRKRLFHSNTIREIFPITSGSEFLKFAQLESHLSHERLCQLILVQEGIPFEMSELIDHLIIAC